MLEVENLCVSYGAVRAVDHVSLRAGEGVVTVILGSNGAGKSSLLKAITGQIPIQSGDIRLAGQSIVSLKPHEIVLRGLSLVPEGRELFSRMSVQENLLVGATTRKGDGVRSDLDRMYDYFPVLGAKRKLTARSLSGGEQQMLACARSLMARPRMLLLDEPTIGLAPVIEQALMATLSGLSRDHALAIVIVEQNAALALATGSYGFVLEQGRVALQGTVSELRNDNKVREAYLGTS